MEKSERGAEPYTGEGWLGAFSGCESLKTPPEE
jgi:hypothetical protein